MNYEFKKIDIDNYSLVYTNKEGREITKSYKVNVNMAKNFNGITERARIKLGDSLTAMGKTKNDFIIKRDLGKGQVVYDETNFRQLEQGFIEEETILTLNDVIVDCFGMNVIELFNDMGMKIDENHMTLEEQNKITMFIQKFSLTIKGEDKSPSGNSNQEEILQ